MTREEAKQLLPIIQAFVAGNQIQETIEGYVGWIDADEINLEYEGKKIKHRIKPGPKYRPFKTQEECWSEMHNHPDFGWVKSKQYGSYALLGNIGNVIIRSTDECHRDSMDYIYDNYTFTDGAPFGVKEE